MAGMLHCNVKGICAQAQENKRVSSIFNFTRSHQMHNIYSSYLHSILFIQNNHATHARKIGQSICNRGGRMYEPLIAPFLITKIIYLKSFFINITL